jgi:hypothetical protein
LQRIQLFTYLKSVDLAVVKHEQNGEYLKYTFLSTLTINTRCPMLYRVPSLTHAKKAQSNHELIRRSLEEKEDFDIHNIIETQTCLTDKSWRIACSITKFQSERYTHKSSKSHSLLRHLQMN